MTDENAVKTFDVVQGKEREEEREEKFTNPYIKESVNLRETLVQMKRDSDIMFNPQKKTPLMKGTLTHEGKRLVAPPPPPP
jgi:hypothetical protein